ncbi:uncharacterized protein LOC112570473 [Pomacea canaliculata]|uniref:uncharacterized protein LOC112570473 n=1 Tax=Pomacea canaliculata TaxID=400727 RepID=UPI000D7398E2|nr:uncharacterized protein LOC112570473 [Pomacea canaliculata]
MPGADTSLGYNCWSHPDNIMGPETSKKIDRAMQCVLLPSFFFIGAPTNIVTMVIFYRQGLRDRMNLCLFCLAFVDLLYVTAQFIMISYCFLGTFMPSQVSFFRWTLLARCLNFIYGSAYVSGCVTMIIAVERCVCVMFPMKAATLISTKTMAIILALTFFLLQGMCSVFAFKETILVSRDPVTNGTIVSATISELYLSHDIFRIIEDIVLSVVSFLNFVVVVLATIITVAKLQSSVSWRKSTTRGRSYLKGQKVLMRMLVVVSCVYILCTSPNVAMGLTRFTVVEYRSDGKQCNLFLATNMIGFVITMFNSSTNFFVYITMSSRFRNELKLLLESDNRKLQHLKIKPIIN